MIRIPMTKEKRMKRKRKKRKRKKRNSRTGMKVTTTMSQKMSKNKRKTQHNRFTSRSVRESGGVGDQGVIINPF
jgi:hypothetical protein